MSSKIPPIGAVIFPGDTQWAIAAQLPASALAATRRRLPKELRNRGSKVVSGTDRMSVLLVFGGSIDDGDELASTLSNRHRAPVYLLDFHEEAYSIRRFEGTRVEYQEGHPADFLESHGIIPPGYEPYESPITTIGVVEGATLDQAQKAFPEARQLFSENSRGVLVRDLSGTVTCHLAEALKLRSFTIFYHREKKTFLCTIDEPGRNMEECFTPGGWSTSGCIVVASILDETTLEGILRVLDIPHGMLFVDGGAADGSQSTP